MKWITREHAKVDRIACPWLIKNFVDNDAEFLFVPAQKVIEVTKEQNAIPFDVPNVELGADTPNRNLTLQSEGLVAVAIGFNIISNDDHDNMAKQFYVYDALYAFCRSAATKKDITTSRH
jgi:hypothetical protein